MFIQVPRPSKVDLAFGLAVVIFLSLGAAFLLIDRPAQTNSERSLEFFVLVASFLFSVCLISAFPHTSVGLRIRSLLSWRAKTFSFTFASVFILSFFNFYAWTYPLLVIFGPSHIKSSPADVALFLLRFFGFLLLLAGCCASTVVALASAGVLFYELTLIIKSRQPDNGARRFDAKVLWQAVLWSLVAITTCSFSWWLHTNMNL